VARLFGRWNEEGQLVADEPAIPDWVKDDADPLDMDIPRQRTLPRWAVLAIAAAVVVLALLLLRRHPTPPAPPARVGSAEQAPPAARQAAVFAPVAPPRPSVASSAGRRKGAIHRRRTAHTLTDDVLFPTF
jgi:hypothetical protein